MLIIPNRTRVKKSITVNGTKMCALFDTGSDINVIQEKTFKRCGFVDMKKASFPFDGIGAQNMTIGYFEVKLTIDDDDYSDTCFVIQNQERLPEFIIGLSTMNQAEVIINANGLAMKKTVKIDEEKIDDSMKNDDNLSALPMCAFLTKVEADFPEFNHIEDAHVRKEVIKLVTEYQPKKIKDSPVKMKIILSDDDPIYQRARRLPPKEKENVNNQIKEWLKDGIIKPSSSEYAVPVVPVKKKDGTTRVCVDYRPINRKIIKDRYPLPVIEDQIDALEGAKVFTTLDLANGFFHVPIEPESQKFTSFITSGGQYEFLRAPFGLCVSPPVFMRFINTVFAELIANGSVIPYMDDIVIPAMNETDALEKLKRVLKTAEEYGLKIKWKKCTVLQRKIEFLGYEIENGKIRPSPAKTIAVKNFSQPKNVKQMQQFLGLTGYFRRFVLDYARIAKPLNDLLRQDTKFIFGTEQQLAFEKLKKIITERPVLEMFQYGLETEVHTDASKFGLAGILFQRSNDDNQMHPV